MKSKFIIILLFLLSVSCSRCPQNDTSSLAVFTDSYGKKVKKFGLLDSVFGSFSRLQADKKYSIQVMRINGKSEKEITRSTYFADENGIIPTIPLWWEIGVSYDNSGIGKIDFDIPGGYKYECWVKEGGKRVHKFPIPITGEKKLVFYSSDKDGNPKNAFNSQGEAVYLSCVYPETGVGEIWDIHIVKDRYSWSLGDRFDPVRSSPVILKMQPGENQQHLIEEIWPAEELEKGNYDIIIEPGKDVKDTVFYRRGLIDTVYGVGFTVFTEPDSEEEPEHMKANIACQELPRNRHTGRARATFNPVYKEYFCPKEEVWAAVTPTNPLNYHTFKNARLYVVNHNTGPRQDKSPLTDVSGLDGWEESLLQPGCANLVYARVWCKPKAPLSKKTGPNVEEYNYDVVVHFVDPGSGNRDADIYNKGIDIIDGGDTDGSEEKGGFYVPRLWVCLESIKFNYAPDCLCSDGIDIRTNAENHVRIHEWEKGLPPYPAAYKINQAVYVEAVFSSAPDIHCGSIIKACRKDGDLGDIITREICFNSGSSLPGYFQVSSLSPGEIKSFHQEWEWYWMYKNESDKKPPKYRHIGNSRNRIYVVLDNPTCPWEVSKTTNAWTQVLDYSCMWAHGTNTAQDAASQIALHFYADTGGIYQKYAYYTGCWNESFKLSTFLGNLAYREIGKVNCHDMGKAQVIFSNVLGGNLMYRYSDGFGGRLNPVKMIGKEMMWRDEDFANHAFASLYNNIFDASLKVVVFLGFSNIWQKSMADIPWEAYIEEVVREGEVAAPYMFTFQIGEKPAPEPGQFGPGRLEKIKKEYKYETWGKETGKIIPGIDVSGSVLPQISGKKKVWKNDNFSIRAVHGDICTVIAKLWRGAKSDDTFRVRMVVCPTFDDAKQFLVTFYANSTASLSSKKQPGAKFDLNIGSVCFVTPWEPGGSGSFSTIDFIRHNVVFMLSGGGENCSKLADSARILDDLLKEERPVKSYKKLKKRPRITHFSSKKKKITVGESVRLIVKVTNPLDSELFRIWRLSSGGIQGESGEGFFYYGEEEGRHTITLIVINKVGLFHRRSLTIEVLPKEEKGSAYFF